MKHDLQKMGIFLKLTHVTQCFGIFQKLAPLPHATKDEFIHRLFIEQFRSSYRYRFVKFVGQQHIS